MSTKLDIPPKPGNGFVLIFRSSITTRDGRKIYASQYGLRGFPIWVRRF